MAFVVGIDLHGTLINDQEIISPDAIKELEEVLVAKPDHIKLFVCTGNDLPFVERKIGSLYNYFDGAVLETGCTVSTNGQDEVVLVEQSIVNELKSLEQKLISANYPQVYKFARRLSSISMFTKYGESLEDFYQLISQELAAEKSFRVTRSSVAVDIIPKEHDKYRGLVNLAKNGEKIVAIADSLNDFELLNQADFAFLPQNHHPDLAQLLSTNRGLKIFNGEATFGVIRALRYLYSL